jgi:hypothetical protein
MILLIPKEAFFVNPSTAVGCAVTNVQLLLEDQDTLFTGPLDLFIENQNVMINISTPG